MKPFLILQLRPNDEASSGEFEAFLRHGGMSREEVVRVRMDQGNLPSINLDDYSAVIVGGGPSNVSDPDEKKSPEQKTFEPWLAALLDEIVRRDFPFFGACYGLGALSAHLDGTVSKEQYGETVGPVTITLSEEGKSDPLFDGLPETFLAFVGHKESCQSVPENAVLLASSPTCPVQMIRVGKNVYASQFHPELDVEGIVTRVNVYRHAGYFPPEDADKVIETSKQVEVTVPPKMFTAFINKYRRD